MHHCSYCVVLIIARMYALKLCALVAGMSVTFLHPPKLDFALKLAAAGAGFDVMQLGFEVLSSPQALLFCHFKICM